MASVEREVPGAHNLVTVCTRLHCVRWAVTRSASPRSHGLLRLLARGQAARHPVDPFGHPDGPSSRTARLADHYLGTVTARRHAHQPELRSRGHDRGNARADQGYEDIKLRSVVRICRRSPSWAWIPLVWKRADDRRSPASPGCGDNPGCRSFHRGRVMVPAGFDALGLRWDLDDRGIAPPRLRRAIDDTGLRLPRSEVIRLSPTFPRQPPAPDRYRRAVTSGVATDGQSSSRPGRTCDELLLLQDLIEPFRVLDLAGVHGVHRDQDAR